MKVLHSKKLWLSISAVVVITISYPLVLAVFFDYEIGSSWSMVEKQLQRAIDAHNPALCNRIIVQPFSMGPAQYDMVNACYLGYANRTGDTSVCNRVIDPGDCVFSYTKKRDDPELCLQAFVPDNQWKADHRGACFGYFAAKD